MTVSFSYYSLLYSTGHRFVKYTQKSNVQVAIWMDGSSIGVKEEIAVIDGDKLSNYTKEPEIISAYCPSIQLLHSELRGTPFPAALLLASFRLTCNLDQSLFIMVWSCQKPSVPSRVRHQMWRWNYLISRPVNL